jgi:branched-chain amino acid transport system substrate-binding protein
MLIYYRFAVYLTVLFLLVLLSVACGKGSDLSSGKVKVGILYPMTGELKDKGLDSMRGIQLAAEEVNASGGIKSLGGAKIELVPGDTAGKPETGSAETDRLIRDDKVVAVIGAYQSSVTKLATQAAEKLETPFVVSMALADIITERGFRYTFRVAPMVRFYCRDQMQFLIELGSETGCKISRVALLHENTDYGTATAFAQKKAMRDYGLKLTTEVSYRAEGVSDLTAEVDRVLKSDPEAILTATYLHDSLLICRALSARRARIPWIDTAGGTVSHEFIQELGRDAEYTFTSAEFSKFASGGGELNKRFMEKFGVNITGDSAYAYQSLWVLYEALERAGTTDRKMVRAALASTDMPRGAHMVLPSERIKFNRDGQNEYAKLFIVQIQNGEYVPVWPGEYSSVKVKLRH